MLAIFKHDYAQAIMAQSKHHALPDPQISALGGKSGGARH